jgi:hypothetical protein
MQRQQQPQQLQQQQQQQQQWANDAADGGFNIAQLQSVMALDEIEEIVAQASGKVVGATLQNNCLCYLAGNSHWKGCLAGICKNNMQTWMLC